MLKKLQDAHPQVLAIATEYLNTRASDEDVDLEQFLIHYGMPAEVFLMGIGFTLPELNAIYNGLTGVGGFTQLDVEDGIGHSYCYLTHEMAMESLNIIQAVYPDARLTVTTDLNEWLLLFTGKDTCELQHLLERLWSLLNHGE